MKQMGGGIMDSEGKDIGLPVKRQDSKSLVT